MKLSPLSKAVLAGGLMLAGGSAFAAPTLTEVLGASGITASGYVEAGYYFYDVDSPLYNAFQPKKDTFDLQQASVTIASQPKEGFGALVNLTAGSNADPIASTPTNNTDNFDVTQAFVQYATGPVTVIAGKYNTLMGAEVIAPTGNTNISRSIAFFNAIAFTHTGLRAAFAPVDGVTFYAGVNNGWDTQQDSARGKTGELGVSWAPVSQFAIAVQAYSGDEASFSGNDTRTLIDAVVTIKPIDALSFVINYDSGKQKDATASGDAKWEAIVGYVNYQITDKFRTSFRAEQFDDKDGWKLGAGKQKVKGLTLTAAYAPTPAFELRGEVRQDKADLKVFDNGNDDTQNYLAVEGLYKF